MGVARGEKRRDGGWSHGPEGALRLWLYTQLARIAEGLRTRGLEADHEVLSGPPVHQGILEAHERMGADVVALSTHGRDPVTRLLTGRVSGKGIRASEGHAMVRREAEEQ